MATTQNKLNNNHKLNKEIMKNYNAKMLPMILISLVLGSLSLSNMKGECSPCGVYEQLLDGEVEKKAGSCDAVWEVTEETNGLIWTKVKCKTIDKDGFFCPKWWHLISPCKTVVKEETGSKPSTAN